VVAPQPQRVVSDRWYAETPRAAVAKPIVSIPPARDAWYLDQRAALPGPALSEQVRDTWYRDARPAAAEHAAPTQRYLVTDRWYLEPALSWTRAAAAARTIAQGYRRLPTS
jgi:hypothetical protein